MIGERIKKLRVTKGISQTALAKVTDMSQQSVWKWERGLAEPDVATISKLSTYFEVSADYLVGSTDMPANIERIQSGVHKIPLLSGIAAGEPILCEESFDTYIDVGEHVKADFALRVVGDSMEPIYQNGDVVFIRAQDDVDDGQIAAVCIDDGGTLKRVYHEKDGIILYSENPRYRPMHYTPDNADNIRIVGLAVAYFRVTK